MTDAPKRIWVSKRKNSAETGDLADLGHKPTDVALHKYVEYIRADVAEQTAGALRAFAFLDANTTQEAWEIRYRDRFQDWIDFDDIDKARAALAAWETDK